MKDPIHLRKGHDGGLHLMAGAHRLEAAKALGWAEIEARIWTGVTDDWARLIEIDDNLAGAEMDALDTAVFLSRRRAIYEKLHPETKHGGDRRSPRLKDQNDIMAIWSFAAATAKKFGLSRRHVERLVAAGDRLAPDQVRALREAPNPVRLNDLMLLGQVDAALRYEMIGRLAEGREATAAKAKRAIEVARGRKPALAGRDAETFVALRNAWARATPAARAAITY